MRFWGNGDYTFENTPITKWTQGEPALVEWMISADHRGNYNFYLNCSDFYFLQKTNFVNITQVDMPTVSVRFQNMAFQE